MGSTPSGVAERASRSTVERAGLARTLVWLSRVPSFPRGREKLHPGRVRSPTFTGAPLRLHVLAQFHIPIGQVHKMTPTVVPVQGEVDLHKGTPLGALGLAHQVHAGFEGRAIGFARVAGDTGADDVF